MMEKVSFLAVLFIVAGGLYAQSSEKTMYVAVKQTELRSSTGFFAGPVGRLVLGDRVTVIRESGKWSQVRTPQVSGWVYTVALNSRRVTGSGYSASASEVSLAGKGFSLEMETAYRNSGVDYAVVDFLEKIQVPAGELRAFVDEGRLSKGE